MALKWILLGCFSSRTSRNTALPERRRPQVVSDQLHSSPQSVRRISVSDLSNPSSPLSLSDLSGSVIGSNLHDLTLSEIKVITRNFTTTGLLGEGGFGRVYKGFIDDKLRYGLKAQSVAVKVLDLDGTQGHREWLAEVIFLGQLRHPNLVKLIGYCCENEQRILVYEYMARGSLENHLFKKYSAALPWLTRLKIAIGAAKGLSFLHEEEKPVIYRDFKASNILLDSDLKAKLSDFGLAKDGPDGEETHVTTRVMGTQGYAAPEYVTTGHLTIMSDVYSYGVVLLEILSGRRSMDKNRPSREQCLVDWATPYLRDHRKIDRLMDPRLEGLYSVEAAKRVAALAYQCLSQRPKARPKMSTVVKTLEPLMKLMDDIEGPFVYVAPTRGDAEKNRGKEENQVQRRKGGNDASEKETEVGERKGYRHNKGARRNRPSGAVHSDTALYKSPIRGVNPTKHTKHRVS